MLRLLDQSNNLMTLEQLGMPRRRCSRRFRGLIERPAGMVLVTGPTGSGKTTTLYSALSYLNRSDTKILTAEDPVEYRLDRVNQVQVNAKIGLDFARVLRTMLRADPDVILVGEMRDRETAEIGLRAAITGHLVFSTLHTLTASATVNRLLDMGVAGYMIATALHGIVAQRLVRQVCPDCAQATEPDDHQLAWLQAQVGAHARPAMKFQTGAGCTYCNLSGYRGRAAIYELIEVDRALADCHPPRRLAGLRRRGARAERLRLADAQRHRSGGHGQDHPRRSHRDHQRPRRSAAGHAPRCPAPATDELTRRAAERRRRADSDAMADVQLQGRGRATANWSRAASPGDTVDQVAQRLISTGVTPLEIAGARCRAAASSFEKLGRALGLGPGHAPPTS